MICVAGECYPEIVWPDNSNTISTWLHPLSVLRNLSRTGRQYLSYQEVGLGPGLEGEGEGEGELMQLTVSADSPRIL